MTNTASSVYKFNTNLQISPHLYTLDNIYIHRGHGKVFTNGNGGVDRSATRLHYCLCRNNPFSSRLTLGQSVASFLTAGHHKWGKVQVTQQHFLPTPQQFVGSTEDKIHRRNRSWQISPGYSKVPACIPQGT